nr:peroxiredoxin-like family protein [Mycobacterium basiliense]
MSTGETIGVGELDTVTGQSVSVPAPAGRTHLQFRRFAGCPICSLHLHRFADRHQQLTDAGITEVVFFHSPAGELRGYQALLPFAVIADPNRVYYRQFGVEKGLRALISPRSWSAGARGYRAALRHRGDPNYAGVKSSSDGETHLGLPADFLIEPDGTIVAVHYGRHADDQWSIDELLDLHHALG